MSKRSSVSPRKFLDISSPPWFDDGLQQDCSEFLIFLLHSLEEGIKMVKDETNSTTSDMQWKNCGGDDEGKTAKKQHQKYQRLLTQEDGVTPAMTVECTVVERQVLVLALAWCRQLNIVY
jgi:hypothetical protein